MNLLTQDAIKMMSENNLKTTDPVLVQILSIDPKPLKNRGNSEHYKARVNDGSASKQVILVNPEPSLVQSQDFTIIKIIKWSTNGSTIWLNQPDIVDDQKCLIGDPTDYDQSKRNKYLNNIADNQIVPNQSLTEQSKKQSKDKKLAIKHAQKVPEQYQFDVSQLEKNEQKLSTYNAKCL